MVFSKDSGLVKVWVSLVMAGTYTLDQVPQLYNLKPIVTEVVNGTA
ncbi:CD1375 family protein [Paenibacillus lautus]